MVKTLDYRICSHCIQNLITHESEYLSEYFLDLIYIHFSNKIIIVQVDGTYIPGPIKRLEKLGYLYTTEISKTAILAKPKCIETTNGTLFICARKNEHE